MATGGVLPELSKECAKGKRAMPASGRNSRTSSVQPCALNHALNLSKTTPSL